jgi:3-methyladenine DNA glycosylase AlkD
VESDSANAALIGAVREGLAQLANPEKAPAMQAYMKSAMPFLGVQAPQQRQLYRQVFAAHPLATFDEWQATVLALWREAHYREERYAAIALAGDRHYRPYQRVETLSLYEELIVTGAWWDLVDELATHRVGELLRRYPEPMRAAMLAWSRDANLWKRRTAILCQATFKADTDEQLLFACIEPNLGDKDFFMRKAIGWALREYAKARPDSVRRYVQEHEAALSPLSRREATKHLSLT